MIQLFYNTKGWNFGEMTELVSFFQKNVSGALSYLNFHISEKIAKNHLIVLSIFGTFRL